MLTKKSFGYTNDLWLVFVDIVQNFNYLSKLTINKPNIDRECFFLSSIHSATIPSSDSLRFSQK